MVDDLPGYLKQYVRRGEFTLRSGRKTTVFYDLKAALCDVAARREILHDMETKVMAASGAFLPAILCGGFGGAILGSMLAERLRAPLVVYDEPRTRIIRPNTLPAVCIVLDDVKTTGDQLRELRRIARQVGMRVIGELVVLDRSREDVGEREV